MLRVFHLEPVRRCASAIGAIAVLRHQALESELARLAKQIRADLALLKGRDEDAIRAARQQEGEANEEAATEATLQKAPRPRAGLEFAVTSFRSAATLSG